MLAVRDLVVDIQGSSVLRQVSLEVNAAAPHLDVAHAKALEIFARRE